MLALGAKDGVVGETQRGTELPRGGRSPCSLKGHIWVPGTSRSLEREVCILRR